MINNILSIIRKAFRHRIKADHQNDFTEELCKFLPTINFETIFDIGANEGQTVEKVAFKYPRAVIHAFEPFSEPFKIAKDKFINNRLINMHKMAVADSNGDRSFSVFSKSYNNSLLKAADSANDLVKGNVFSQVDTINVPVVTLDYFCEKHGIKTINLLKIDVQGGELMVLNGAKKLLQNKLIDCLYIEILFAHLYDSQAWYSDIFHILHGHGYRLVKLYDISTDTKGRMSWGDALFVKD